MKENLQETTCFKFYTSAINFYSSLTSLTISALSMNPNESLSVFTMPCNAEKAHVYTCIVHCISCMCILGVHCRYMYDKIQHGWYTLLRLREGLGEHQQLCSLPVQSPLWQAVPDEPTWPSMLQSWGKKYGIQMQRVYTCTCMSMVVMDT